MLMLRMMILDATHLLFEHVEIVNDDSNEEVQSEKRPHYNKHHEEPIRVEVGLPPGLFVDLQK